jgi:threonine/homoserine/homoserine lactone efflux protein
MVFTPGPNTITSMNNAAKVGLKKGIFFNFGIFSGLFVLLLICMAFSSLLYRVIPQIQLPMKIIGAAYIVYLAVKTFLPPKEVKNMDIKKSFLAGVLLQFVNPKIILYGITALSSFILPHYKSIPILVLFCLMLAFFALVSTTCWALFGTIFSAVFSKYRKVLNVILAVLLLYCAVSLFL